MLADRDQAIAIHQQAAIAGRIGGAETEHRERRALGEGLAHPRKRLRRNQRRIAEDHQQIVGAARNRLARRQHRMRRAEPLALDKGLGVGADAADFVGDRLVVGADHHRKPRVPARRRGMQDMREQRLSGHGMQHLRQAGAHPRALAGREHDCQARSCGHSTPKVAARNFIGALLKAFSRAPKMPGIQAAAQFLIMFPCDSLMLQGLHQPTWQRNPTNRPGFSTLTTPKACWPDCLPRRTSSTAARCGGSARGAWLRSAPSCLPFMPTRARWACGASRSQPTISPARRSRSGNWHARVRSRRASSPPRSIR